MKTYDMGKFVKISEIYPLKEADFRNLLEVKDIDKFVEYIGSPLPASEVIKKILSHKEGVSATNLLFNNGIGFHTVHGFGEDFEEFRETNNFLKDIDDETIISLGIVTALASLVKEEADRGAKPISTKKTSYSFRGEKYKGHNVMYFDNKSRIMPIAKWAGGLSDYIEHCFLLRRKHEKDIVLPYATSSDSGW